MPERYLKDRQTKKIDKEKAWKKINRQREGKTKKREQKVLQNAADFVEKGRHFAVKNKIKAVEEERKYNIK